MGFLEYWDSRIEFYKKYRSIFENPVYMNELHDEALNAWEAALSEKEKECERLVRTYREFIQKVLDNKYEPDKLLILCGRAIKQALGEGEGGEA